MRQVRSGVFESNSSSMHSLTVMKKNDKYTSEEILDGIRLYNDEETGEKKCVWNIWDDRDLQFGRSPFRALGTFKDKWLYACASLVHDYNDDIYKELVDIAFKYIPGLTKIELPMTYSRFADKDDEYFKNDTFYQEYGKTEEELCEYLSQRSEDWGIEITYWKDGPWWEYDAPYTGSVDEDILSRFLKKEDITLEEYLTNKKYVVIQDGDEYCYWDDMKKTGLVNLDMIDHEYPEEDENYETVKTWSI